MVERPENLALARDALDQTRPGPGDVRQLDRDWTLHQAVDALPEPHRAHAPFAQLAHEPVRADRGADAAGGAPSADRLRCRPA